MYFAVVLTFKSKASRIFPSGGSCVVLSKLTESISELWKQVTFISVVGSYLQVVHQSICWFQLCGFVLHTDLPQLLQELLRGWLLLQCGVVIVTGDQGEEGMAILLEPLLVVTSLTLVLFVFKEYTAQCSGSKFRCCVLVFLCFLFSLHMLYCWERVHALDPGSDFPGILHWQKTSSAGTGRWSGRYFFPAHMDELLGMEIVSVKLLKIKNKKSRTHSCVCSVYSSASEKKKKVKATRRMRMFINDLKGVCGHERKY